MFTTLTQDKQHWKVVSNFESPTAGDYTSTVAGAQFSKTELSETIPFGKKTDKSLSFIHQNEPSLSRRR